MERIVGLTLLSVLLNWRNTNNGDATLSPSWRSTLSAQVSTNIPHGTRSVPYRYSLHEDDSTIHHQSQLIGQDISRNQCALYKVLMTQQFYIEYIHYKIDLPDLKEFTLCMWKKFTNHTNDHPLFSYAVGNQPRSILSWISNTPRSSYYMLNIDGHNLYRLNYPLRLNRWYHSCQSWNGHTGEWQIWVNDERVGRGFNNRLVGHVIKGGGIAISGQEQRQIGGGFLKTEHAPLGIDGMMGELTMVQLYGVALTAGKAHRDHKHHHAHHFEHNTNNNVPPALTTPALSNRISLPMNPYLTGGQLNHQVKINPGAHIQIVRNGVLLRHPNLPVPSVIPQPLPPTILPVQTTVNPHVNSLKDNLSFDFSKGLVDIDDIGVSKTVGTSLLSTKSISSSPVNGYGVIDRHYRDVIIGNTKSFDKIENNLHKQSYNGYVEDEKMINHIELKKISKRESLDLNIMQKERDKKSFKKYQDGSRLKRSTNNVTMILSLDQKKQKRGLVFTDDFLIDNLYIHQIPEKFDSNDNYFKGLMNFGPPLITSPRQKDKEEREPAEEEVKRVMHICDGCENEPFEKAIVLSWRTVPKKLYSGALHVPAIQACKAF